MKIVSFYELVALPVGTIYSYYEPAICTGLYRKGENIIHPDGNAHDFYEGTLIAQCINGEHPAVDDVECRWGWYDYDQQYAVYESEDLALMREMLNG